jgi:hypothetical protein
MTDWQVGRQGTAKKRILAVALVAVGCISLGVFIVEGNSPVRFEQVALPSLQDVSDSAWERLSQKRIYFGHQSVGFNIITGIEDLMKANPRIRLNILETDNHEDLNVPIFSHSKVGRNKHPQSKIDAFVAGMDKGIAGKADIAFFKFCYADVGAETDVNQVFSEYKRAMSDLRKRYPGTTFVHVTVPLTLVQTGIKAGIKRLIGKPIHGYDDNPARSLYNTMLRREYEGREPLFDLAKTEAASPRGKRALFTKEGITFHGMFPAYTYDGGHLTEQGRVAAAQQLLILLADLAE